MSATRGGQKALLTTDNGAQNILVSGQKFIAALDAVGSVFRCLRRGSRRGMLIVARGTFFLRLCGSLGSPSGFHRSRELSTAFW